MAHTNPLGKIKDLAVGSLKVPLTAAGAAVGLAKGAAGGAAHAAGSLVGQGKDGGHAAPDADVSRGSDTARDGKDAEDAPLDIRPDEPVNVTEELGLDPAPVEKPKPAKKRPAKKAATKIDAAADPSAVDATPADVAKAVSKEGGAQDQPTG